MRETKKISISAHRFYNDLFDNNSPLRVLEEISTLINGKDISWWKKQCFIKFCLCVVKEKLVITKRKEKFDELGRVIKEIDIDSNNGNKMKLETIVALLGLTESNIAFYIDRNFFPANWQYLDEEIWSCFL